MANVNQRSTGRRKLIYFGIIAVLFTATIFVRGVVALPLSGLKEKAGKYTIRTQARELELTEYEAEEATGETQREAELTGSAVRLLLTGSRGFAVCVLWITAHEKQMRQEWNELELTVKSITTLQPHFVTPWLFQSWNLTYNVSVEMDRLNDMYFYISRGITLLSEGESINRYNPDMRYAIAFYYQNKFTVSDKVTTLRSLLQMSCMPAEDRNPDNLLVEGKVDAAKFKAFCANHPQFVRRLRETPIRIGKMQKEGHLVDQIQFLAPTRELVVAFLRDNQKLPTRYSREDPKRLETRLKQFPVVPPTFTNDISELKANEEWRDNQASAILACRSWYKYANEAIPPPNPVPGPTQEYRDPERRRRVPRQPMLIIFRQGPPRAQTYHADQLAKDGWFDSDPWVVDQGLTADDERWFTDYVEIEPLANSQAAWSDAHTMWLNHGRDNGLNFTVDQMERYRAMATAYAQRRGFPIPDSVMRTDVPGMRPDEQNDPWLRQSYDANMALAYFYRNRQVTNYESFLTQAEAEMDALTVRARKIVRQADRERSGYGKSAVAKYEQVLGTQADIEKLRNTQGDEDRLLWARVLLKFKKFAENDKAQEDIFDTQINYLRLLQSRDAIKFKQITMGLFSAMRASGSGGLDTPFSLAETAWIFSGKLEPTTDEPASAFGLEGRINLPLPVFGITLTWQWSYQQLAALSQSVETFWPQGPFDGVNPETNRPWIGDLVRTRALLNAGLTKQPGQGQPAPQSGSTTPKQ
jgi:hypothetical protein